MEASERQFPHHPESREHDAAEGAVRAIDGRLVIERLEVDDERAARVVRERAKVGQPPARTVKDAVEIGARVLEREGLATEVDYVRGEFERSAGELRHQFTEQARAMTEALQGELERVFAAEGGEVAQVLDAHADELAGQIATSFGADRSSAVQNQIREQVTKALRESRDELVRQFSAEDGANPLSDFKGGVVRVLKQANESQDRRLSELQERLGELQVQLARLDEQAEAKRRLAEAEERGTAKGRSFEERVFAALERMADGRGDAARAVGDERGEGGTRKGDVLVEIDAASGPSAGRIAIEAKTERLSKKRAWEELNDAMAERDAEFGVLVVAGEERVPAGREQLHEYEGNKLIVAADPEEPDGLGLEIAYRYARCRVLMARDRSLTVDAAGVRDAAEEAASALKQAQAIRLALTSATNSVEKAREGVDEMTDDVRRRLERIESLVSAAE